LALISTLSGERVDASICQSAARASHKPAAQVRTAAKADANSSRWYLSRRATKIAAEFGCRTDTLRERLVNALQRRYRKQVASGQLIKAVYGARSKHASHSSLVSRPL
jgi:hypothetical protein